ncbi:MAG: NAD(P)/FAD-dependent oxidoreductase [Moraxellaceae bacterium]|nr:MAG: NAD(P)/FAD-dependent oxidoreductase [Moraxellaceae bacterium]
MQYDVIIIGASYAGLSAGLPLVRARRNVLMIDSGQRRNRFATHSHGFLTQDGTDAATIAHEGRKQLLAYDTISWLDAHVSDIKKLADGFEVCLADHEPQQASRLILATGITDVLPDLPGLAERWGQSIFHCPYCHGYELNQGQIGVLATSELSLHVALMLPDWGSTTLFLNGALEPNAEQLAQLKARHVSIEQRRIQAIENNLDMRMEDETIIRLDGLFVTPQFIQTNSFAQTLGCDMEQMPLGQIMKTSVVKATTVSGVFACGDAARFGGSVPLAVGDGTIAGAAAHQSLIFGI